MNVKAKVALMGALLISGAALAQTPADVNNKFNEAASLLNAKKSIEAIPVLEAVISEGLEAGPDVLETVQKAQKLLPTCYLQKGAKSAQGGDFDQALIDFGKAEELAELYGVTNVKNQASGMLVKVYMVDGGKAFNEENYAKAIEVFSKAYEKYPNNTEMAMLLAKSYSKSGDKAKAGEIYKNIIALESKHSKYAEAAAEARKEFATDLLVDASQAAEANNLEEVVKITDEILAVDSTNNIANMLRLQTAINVKDYDAAIGFGEAVADAQTTDEEKSNAYFYLGAAYQNKENAAKAIELYKKVTAGGNVDMAKEQIAALSK